MEARTRKEPPQKVKANLRQMASGLASAAVASVRNGKVDSLTREARFDTCKACPSLIKESKRCSECGCFMQAKTWINGNPDVLCPLKKWEA